MKESIREFDEIYEDFWQEHLNENIEDTTISAEAFHQEWHRILDETYCSNGNCQKRIGEEIASKKIWKQLLVLIDEGKVLKIGKKRWLKYQIVEQRDNSNFLKNALKS